jgi:hypothetical protein
VGFSDTQSASAGPTVLAFLRQVWWMKRRILRHTRNSIEFLGHNNAFNFARAYALRLFRQNAIYTFIPKNACSTMRLTLAIENGCIRDDAEHRWIHANNTTFRAQLPDLMTSDYTFVILRDPFKRIVSCFLDKVMRKDPPVEHMTKFLADRNIPIDEISFTEFLEFLATDGMLTADEHWHPQAGFLIYEDYDEYFSLENFPHAVSVLESRLGIRVADSRSLIPHGRDYLKEIDVGSDLSRTPMSEFRRMRAEGLTPALRNLFSDECVELVRRLYKSDIDEYERRIGPVTDFEVEQSSVTTG